MKRIALVLILVATTGCASLRQANGSLNYLALISDAQWGVLAACSQQWLNAESCTYATDALTLASTIVSRNQPGAVLAARQSLIDAEAKLPVDSRIRPFIDWLIRSMAPQP